MQSDDLKLDMVETAGPSSYFYLLQNPKRIKHNHPYISLNKEECFFGVLKQLEG